MTTEGHFTITYAVLDEDVDHGPCVGFYISELSMWVWHYQNDPTRISFDLEKKE